MRSLVLVMFAATLAAAAPPSAYQCYPGKPKKGEGCTCPGGFASARDRDDAAYCKAQPPPPITPPPATAPEIKLVVHTWAPRKLPKLPEQPLEKQPAKEPLVVESGAPRKPTGPTDREIDGLAQTLQTTTGPKRLAVLHRLAQAYAARGNAQKALAASKELVNAMDFAHYANADVALYEHALLVAPDEARVVIAQLLKQYPSSVHVPDAYLWLAESAFAAGDLAKARAAYDRVLKFPKHRTYGYAQYKLGWVDFNEAKHLDAMRAWEQAAKAGDPTLRRVALRDLVRPYVEVGLPDKVFEYFERLDAATALDRMRDVADGYADSGRGAKARLVYRDLVMREQDTTRICEASAGALKASLQANQRADVILDVAALGSVASAADAKCKVVADELFGEIAYAWHLEVTKTKADARHVLELWTHASGIATTPERRAASQYNFVAATWDQAATARGARFADWIIAGEAMLASQDQGMRDAAIDAYDNALRAARATKTKLPQIVALRVKSGLAKINSDRAKKLLAELK